ncbi:MAG: GAF domain-containing sensor histidine kinase [Firmicutes bacterium]|nr:GAF domain-containing sensor histidine kinase [Bacillota bacterium]
MGSFKVVFLARSFAKYTAFLAILKGKYPDASVVSDLNELNRELSAVTDRDIAAVFIEHSLLEQITADFPFYHQTNILWIALAEGSVGLLHVGPFVYDILEYETSITIQRFLRRLKKDVACRIQLKSLETEVQEFYTVGKILAAEKDTRVLLETIVDACMDMTSSDAGTIYLVVDENGGEWSTYSRGDTKDKVLKFVIAKNRSINLNIKESVSPISRESMSGYAVVTGMPLRIDDAYDIPDGAGYGFNTHFDETTGYRTKSVLTVPMKDHKDRVLGVIQLINKKDGEKVIPFESRDEMIISSLAGQAAVALENSLLYRDMEILLEQYRIQNEKLRELSEKILRAHEEERKRIARDIHDGPAQFMSSCSLKIEILKKYLQRNMFDSLNQALDDLNEGIKLTAKDIRKIVYDLKPTALEAGLIKALETYFSLFMKETGIKVAFSHTGDDAGLEYYLLSTLYRIVIEVCTNTRKHAEAGQMEVDLRIEPERIYLLAADNGKGFDPQSIGRTAEEKLRGGFGLEGIRERVELVQGRLDIYSAPGKGTRIEITIPRKQSFT